MNAAQTDKIPVASEMCATCAYREGSRASHLSDGFLKRLKESNPTHLIFCHSTGVIGEIHGCGKRYDALCRGAHNILATQ